MKDNFGITGGYRINFNTPARILRSLFMLHNESVNIWTHCLPAVVLLCLVLSFVVVVDGPAALHQHRSDIEQNLHAFHQRLRNITLAEEAQHEVAALKASVLEGYQELLAGIEGKSL
jgi:adiponectin receptor